MEEFNPDAILILLGLAVLFSWPLVKEAISLIRHGFYGIPVLSLVPVIAIGLDLFTHPPSWLRIAVVSISGVCLGTAYILRLGDRCPNCNKPLRRGVKYEGGPWRAPAAIGFAYCPYCNWGSSGESLERIEEERKRIEQRRELESGWHPDVPKIIKATGERYGRVTFDDFLRWWEATKDPSPVPNHFIDQANIVFEYFRAKGVPDK